MSFYFGPRSPMLYRIACDHRDGRPDRYPGGDRPLVYLSTTIGSIFDAGLRWVATDGNAATLTTRFTSDPTEADSMIDWPLMMEKYWNNTPEAPDRQRRRMAELLVHRAVPVVLFRHVAVYESGCANQVREILAGHGLAHRIVVRPGWYYGYGRS
jgi:hypothetical protein